MALAPPDPARARGLDELVGCLRGLKVWAGDPSFETITRRINQRWRAAGRRADELARRSTVVDCFKPGRRRINADLMVAVVQALHDYPEYLARWREALRDGRVGTETAAQVRVADRLPADLATFVGRTAELARIDGPVTVLTGMPGAGKTALAVRAAHREAAAGRFDATAYADLRGFHPDPALPAAQPGQVLDALLRLAITGRALLVLDNAASAEQVRPLLDAFPGARTIITSSRRLGGPAVEVGPLEAADGERFLRARVPGVPVGPDPSAYRRVAHHCGGLPLALDRAAGDIAARPGWTVTDHADRLDEGRGRLDLDEGLESVFLQSYRKLPPRAQLLLRRLALHPGPDLGAGDAAALLGAGAEAHLACLADEHLIQCRPGGRFALHVLVATYAARRSHDEDRPADRVQAMARLNNA
ncbi:hypothetical protein ACQP00_28630 [Dactylosporangium sp. CS-047395]|uniref:hypothetical protein n=1 Tax=Dactylosporangium sp. CS-047395 TaxID=3239936 RepID=UPI003D8D569F